MCPPDLNFQRRIPQDGDLHSEAGPRWSAPKLIFWWFPRIRCEQQPNLLQGGQRGSSMEALQGELAVLVCEFLEVCIHQLLCVCEVYPPEIFERRRHLNVPVQWARHPDLREYIHSAVTNLQPWIQQGVVEKIAVVFLDGNQVPVEKVMFKLCLKQVTGSGSPPSQLEFALRGFLLKLSVSDWALSPLAPDCSWEVVAYMKALSSDISSKGQFWIPAEEKETTNPSFMITPIKSMRSSCLDMQLYIEHPAPAEEPPKREK